MSRLGWFGWVVLAAATAAVGCNSGGGGGTGAQGGTGASAGTGAGGGASAASSGTGGEGCQYKSAACQTCIPKDCQFNAAMPPPGWQTFVDCVCSAQLAQDKSAEQKCADTFSNDEMQSGLYNCIYNACDCG